MTKNNNNANMLIIKLPANVLLGGSFHSDAIHTGGVIIIINIIKMYHDPRARDRLATSPSCQISFQCSEILYFCQFASSDDG